MSISSQYISESQYYKYIRILRELGRFKYLLRDEFHRLCAPEVKAISNFYPLLHKMESYKYIEAYRVLDGRLERIFDSRERNRLNVIYRLSHFGWEFLSHWEQLSIDVILPDGSYLELEIDEPMELKFNSHINHNIICTQTLSWVVQALRRKGYSQFTYSTDYLLRRVIGKSGEKIPDFLLKFESSNGVPITYWCECEHSRKKTKNIKDMMLRLSLLSGKNLKKLVFYPTNAKGTDGFVVSHRKNIEAAARNYSMRTMKLFLYEFELVDTGSSKVPLLGGANLRSAGHFDAIPTLFSLLGSEISTHILGWNSDIELDGNQEPLSLFQSFKYFISKRGGIYIVAPVVLVPRDYYGDIRGVDEIDRSKEVRVNSRPLAIQRAAEFIQERYGRVEFLRVLQIYMPTTFKAFKNLENAKINHQERQKEKP